jgi:hypothetical protein
MIFVDLDLVEALEAVVLERLLPVAPPPHPPLASAMHGGVEQLVVVDLEVGEHERPVQLTGPVDSVAQPGDQFRASHWSQYPCDGSATRHRPPPRSRIPTPTRTSNTP